MSRVRGSSPHAPPPRRLRGPSAEQRAGRPGRVGGRAGAGGGALPTILSVCSRTGGGAVVVQSQACNGASRPPARLPVARRGAGRWWAARRRKAAPCKPVLLQATPATFGATPARSQGPAGRPHVGLHVPARPPTLPVQLLTMMGMGAWAAMVTTACRLGPRRACLAEAMPHVGTLAWVEQRMLGDVWIADRLLARPRQRTQTSKSTACPAAGGPFLPWPDQHLPHVSSATCFQPCTLSNPAPASDHQHSRSPSLLCPTPAAWPPI